MEQSVGERVRAGRRALHFSQQQLATLLGTSRQRIGQIERASSLRDPLILRLSAVLRIPAGEFQRFNRPRRVARAQTVRGSKPRDYWLCRERDRAATNLLRAAGQSRDYPFLTPQRASSIRRREVSMSPFSLDGGISE